MLSYRHGFHAGNHGDVLKHWVLVLISEYMGKKDKPYWYVDTHSAAGGYDLRSDDSLKTGEFENGIAKLWKQDTPQVFHSYLQLVKQFNTDGELNLYPGSPWFVRQCMREQDKARLFELHPQDFALLKQNFSRDRQVNTDQQDGFGGLKSILPPPTKRAMVAIDPPYELPKEYDQVVSCVKQSLKQFATGVYVVWYPLINRNTKQEASEAMVNRLKNAGAKSVLDVRLWVNGKQEEKGMYGSGLTILNPPWVLKEQLETGLPYLVKKLGKTESAGFKIDFKES